MLLKYCEDCVDLHGETNPETGIVINVVPRELHNNTLLCDDCFQSREFARHVDKLKIPFMTNGRWELESIVMNWSKIKALVEHSQECERQEEQAQAKSS